MKVIIVGPDLPMQSIAYHVHAANCCDLSRGWIAQYAQDESTIEVSSRLDVELVVYGMIIDETPTDRLGDYQDDFYFAPCVSDLPTTG